MMKALWTLGKTFVLTYKTWFVVGSVVAVFGLIAGHLVLDNMRVKKLAFANARVEHLQKQNEILAAQTESQRDRIRTMNAAQLRALAEAAERIKLAEDQAVAVALERDLLNEELEVTRFETLEAIRDDEDMADWVDWDVPVIAWERLQDTASH